MNSGIIFLTRISGSVNQRIIYFRLYFRSLYEQKCFDVDLPRKYYYPQNLLIDNLRRKKGRINRYQFLSDQFLHKLYLDSNYIIEFTQGPDFDKYGFWEELEAWRSRLGYKIFLLTKCTNEINFVEIKSIEEFYKEDFL